ncbi:MAG: flexitail domain-containing putative surface protein [Dehalococcoidia bacterium]
MRSYRLHVPPTYNGLYRVPLVLSYHPLSSTALSQELYSAMSPMADSFGFIVVYPEGTVTSGNNFNHFNITQLPSPEPDEVAFTEAMLDSLEASLCIDTNRVFSTGFSNGAMMSVRLACSLPDRIAAIAPVAAAYYPQLDLTYNPSETCIETTPVPVIAFHGTSDTFVPFNGGPGGVPGVISLDFRLPIDNTTLDDDVLQSWAAHNGCTGGRSESPYTSEVRFVSYGDCDADTQLYIIDGGGHTWPDAQDSPGLGYTTHQISANDLMWTFFQAHPLGGAPQSDLDGDTVPDINDDDDDNDGCTDAAEMVNTAGSEETGGRRNAKNPWDFFDTDGNKVIDLFIDIFAVANAFGLTPSDPGYSTTLDRSAAIGDPWDMGPPDGTIDLFIDIFGVAYQFGHDCT